MMTRFFNEHLIIDTVDDLDMDGVLVLPKHRALEVGIKPNGEVDEYADYYEVDQVFGNGIDPSLN